METFAVIKTGGKQYRVKEGDTLQVELLGGIDAEHTDGETITFDEVLLIDDGSSVKVGTPVLDGAKVEAEYMSRVKGKKHRVQKFTAKSNYDKVIGHRQKYDEVKITNITG
jgi:large subunit ribosomal protein L21